MTGGGVADMCQFGLSGYSDASADPDWSSVFASLASGLTEQSKLSCTWAIPPPTTGSIDPHRVNVRFTPSDGQPLDLSNIPAQEDCGSEDGWQYDNDESPTRIQLCPTTCALTQAQSGASLQVLFGCKTRPHGPRR